MTLVVSTKADLPIQTYVGATFYVRSTKTTYRYNGHKWAVYTSNDEEQDYQRTHYVPYQPPITGHEE